MEALRNLESSPLCQKLSMESFLNLPMQRVTRLPLLLDAIQKMLQQTGSVEEREACKQALEAVREVTYTEMFCFDSSEFL